MTDPIKDAKKDDVDEKTVKGADTAKTEGEVADTDLEGASGGTFTVLSLGDETPLDGTFNPSYDRSKPRKGTHLYDGTE